MPGEWTFLSNHGHALVSLARRPDSRMRDVADVVGIAERAVQEIVRALVAQGHLRKEKWAVTTTTRSCTRRTSGTRWSPMSLWAPPSAWCSAGGAESHRR